MFSLATILAVLVCVGAAAKDESLVEKAYGRAVVEATISKIEAQDFFKKDHFFVRRLAYVDTNDGKANETFKPDFYGGIWKIDKTSFEKTKLLDQSFLDDMNTYFEVDWSETQWEDLLKPFHSALATYLYLEYLDRNFVERLSYRLDEQGKFWSKHFSEGSDALEFSSKSLELDEEGCRGGASDVLFLLDGTTQGTIFNSIKETIGEIMEKYKVGDNEFIDSRFSVVQFSDKVSSEFNFKEHTSMEKYLKAVNSIKLHTSSTYKISEALKYVAESGFSVENGARPQGTSKVVVFFSLRASEDTKKTIEAAERLHEENVQVFLVAIGASFDEKEVHAIASKPHYVHLDYPLLVYDLLYFKHFVGRKMCQAPVTVTNESEVALTKGKETQFIFEIDSDGNSIEVQVLHPKSKYQNALHCSRYMPAKATIHEFELNITSDSSSHLFIPYEYNYGTVRSPYIYCSAEGQKKTGYIKIQHQPGDTSASEGLPEEQ